MAKSRPEQPGPAAASGSAARDAQPVPAIVHAAERWAAASGHARGQEVPRLLYRIEEAARSLAIGRTALYDLIRAGELRTVHVGRSARVTAAQLAAYVDRLIARGAEPLDE